ncbi:hypothetical protein BS47DRAFT_1363460 [Hydnum rufescens UP504]|uniref:Uncharacterized protein n=1 Tax=Hydnum rufescens UP504 TaxID=1448309 RepID=A0A9P6AUG6_9AGAM|nr:hypothetical protein BS47DRAFT_1363460 [Hydnum rufescens UP504]
MELNPVALLLCLLAPFLKTWLSISCGWFIVSVLITIPSASPGVDYRTMGLRSRRIISNSGPMVVVAFVIGRGEAIVDYVNAGDCRSPTSIIAGNDAPSTWISRSVVSGHKNIARSCHRDRPGSHELCPEIHRRLRGVVENQG